MDSNWDEFLLTQSTMPGETQPKLLAKVIDGTVTVSPFKARDIIPRKQLGSPESSPQSSDESDSDSSSATFLDIDVAAVARCSRSPICLVGDYGAPSVKPGCSSNKRKTFVPFSIPSDTSSDEELREENNTSASFRENRPVKERGASALDTLMKNVRLLGKRHSSKLESAKATYQNLLCRLKVINDKQYDTELINNSELRKTESRMNPGAVQQTKKLMFNQNLYRPFKQFLDYLPNVKYTIREKEVFHKKFERFFFVLHLILVFVDHILH